MYSRRQVADILRKMLRSIEEEVEPPHGSTLVELKRVVLLRIAEFEDEEENEIVSAKSD